MPLATNGDANEAVCSTSLLLTTPAMAAAILLMSVARPKICERSRDERVRLFAEVTSQDSNDENNMAVPKPPRRRPENNRGRDGNWMQIQANV